jgi:polyhydroxyalkanoate synthesis regulator phasin
MAGDPFGDKTKAGRQRLVQQLDRMVERGQVTKEEADRMRSAGNPDEFDAAVIGVRLRHAGARLDEAVVTGQMTRQEADENLEKLRQGEHPRALRSHLRKLMPRSR